MDLEDVIDDAVLLVGRKTDGLNDADFITVFEGVIDNLQIAVDAKKEERG